MKEYSLNFTQLSKHAPTTIAYYRPKMNIFFMGIIDLYINECRSAMFIHSMDISRLTVHAGQIVEQKLKQVGRELK